MTHGVETRIDGDTLVVRIPMRFQRRGGRKRIDAPDGCELALASKPQPDGTLVNALARAWRWHRVLDDAAYATVSEIGDAENISKSYMSAGSSGSRSWRRTSSRRSSWGNRSEAHVRAVGAAVADELDGACMPQVTPFDASDGSSHLSASE